MYKLYIEKNISSHDLLKKILKEEYNIDSFTIIKNEFGKPYLKDNQLYFSISHDIDTCAIAISSSEIGIDLEYLNYNERVINKYFYDAEKEIMEKSNNLKYDFTKIWVKKEAYLKMKGTGLNFGKENVDTTKIDAKIIDYNDYLIAVCEV